jgi:uncharacterized protein (TIGR00255 family)
MALRSMTGFGQAGGLVGDVEIVVQIRSVNHKGLDAKVSLPSALLPLETKVLGVVRERMGRGRVEVKVRTEVPGGAARPLPVFNDDAVRALASRLRAACDVADVQAPLQPSDLLAFREALTVDPRERIGVDVWPVLEGLLVEALTGNLDERDREGAALTADMVARLTTIGERIESIAAVWPSLRDGHMERLRERVTEAVARFGVEEVSEDRLIQEVILVADRSDISEEITRARAHVERLLGLIQGHKPAADGPIGKKLDFYFQELMREANTTGSKSHSEVIAGHVVEIRSEIDRLREQVLNVS